MKRRKALLLCIVGGGRMGEALVRGLLESGAYRREQIQVAEPKVGRRNWLKKKYGIQVSKTNASVVSRADVCVLAVKPQEMGSVLQEIGPDLPAQAVVISVAAGISTDWIQERLGKARKIVRVMPNAAVLVGQSATGLYFRPGIGDEARKTVLRIFGSVGKTEVVDKEEHLNIVTGLSGSGPAYVFLFLEALTDAGVCQGLPRELAARLAMQTVLGSACMASELDKPFSLLKEIITSPGGTTMAGLRVLEEGAVRATLIKAVEQATRRSEELSL